MASSSLKEVCAIRKIPMGSIAIQDNLVWHFYQNSNNYMVKLGYQAKCEHFDKYNQMLVAPSSSERRDWKGI